MTDPRVAVRNASDPQQVEDAQRKERNTADRDRDDVLTLLTFREFRRFAWRHIGQCGVFQVADPTASESVRAFTDGKRIIGNTLLHAIQSVSIDGYLLMQREALTEEQQHGTRHSNRSRNRNAGRSGSRDADASVQHTVRSEPVSEPDTSWDGGGHGDETGG